MFDRGERSVDELAQSVRQKHERLLGLYETTWPHAFEDLERAQRMDIVYTSNALEGNTLLAGETALVLETGFAIGGKPIGDHIQVLDHAYALEVAYDVALRDNQASKFRAIRSSDLAMLNWTLLRRQLGEPTSTFARPSEEQNEDQTDRPPQSVIDLCNWLKTQPNTPETAITVHNRLIRARPFVSGNGLTARRAMNFILMRGGLPAVAIRREDEAEYIGAFDADGDDAVVTKIVFHRLDETLDLYLNAAEHALATANRTDQEP